MYSPLLVLEYLLSCEEHTFAYSETFKKSTPFALKKIRCVTSGPQTRTTSSKNFLLGRRFSASHFLRTSSTSPLYSSVYLYNQMIAIQRTSASLGATTGARSSNATSRKNHRAAAASTVTRRNGMRSHSVTSMERRTKNSFRLPAIAMPSPEVNEQMMQTMTYNETGKWRENFDLAGWAKEIREVRFSSLEFKSTYFSRVR